MKSKKRPSQLAREVPGEQTPDEPEPVVLTVVQAGPGRTTALYELRRAMLDLLEPMELQDESIGRQAAQAADVSMHCRGLHIDPLSRMERADLFADAFARRDPKSKSFSKSGPYDRVRVRVADGLHAARAIPPKTSKHRKAKLDTTFKIQRLIARHRPGRMAILNLTLDIMLVFIHGGLCAYLRSENREHIAGLVHARLAAGLGVTPAEQLAFDIVDDIWTSDPNVDPAEEPPAP